MTIDAARAGLRIREVTLPLSHRATGRNLRGFAHRGRQQPPLTHLGAAGLVDEFGDDRSSRDRLCPAEPDKELSLTSRIIFPQPEECHGT